jgi:hypothetical protein
MGAVRPAHRDDREQIAPGVNLHSKRRKREIAKGTEFARHAERAEHFLIAQGRVVFAWLFVLIAPLQVAAIWVIRK